MCRSTARTAAIWRSPARQPAEKFPTGCPRTRAGRVHQSTCNPDDGRLPVARQVRTTTLTLIYNTVSLPSWSAGGVRSRAASALRWQRGLGHPGSRQGGLWLDNGQPTGNRRPIFRRAADDAVRSRFRCRRPRPPTAQIRPPTDALPRTISIFRNSPNYPTAFCDPAALSVGLRPTIARHPGPPCTFVSSASRGPIWCGTFPTLPKSQTTRGQPSRGGAPGG